MPDPGDDRELGSDRHGWLPGAARRQLNAEWPHGRHPQEDKAGCRPCGFSPLREGSGVLSGGREERPSTPGREG
ncbi:hypothetical protein GCM10010168_82100 [Actinoplanes ianthinogenes]|uniref:Uncharacterized protein n=1 Tax=Actinoplanes ianthinogenes TaxID=122358 RepID=A0ABM7LMH7_9ACTN|nr:hypothetical protein Aiant_11130 [Actinoplanes ianthinogenes]GGR50755.1 hypothetical protein GCM10010168_82100 [Actinoplanes ianthinogenes]